MPPKRAIRPVLGVPRITARLTRIKGVARDLSHELTRAQMDASAIRTLVKAIEQEAGAALRALKRVKPSRTSV